jgi:tripartite-type tricarboxylate transporter receptor subunit TctC
MLYRRALLAAPALALPAAAQSWPSRPISMLIGFAPGGGTDIIARAIQPQLQEELGQPIAMENRPGASGTLAAGLVSRARPDGYTLLMTTVSASAVVPPLMNPPPYDIYRDQVAVVHAATVPLVAVVPLNAPSATMRDLLERARREPAGARLGHFREELADVVEDARIRRRRGARRGADRLLIDEDHLVYFFEPLHRIVLPRLFPRRMQPPGERTPEHL